VEKRAWLLIVGSDATDDPRVLSRLSRWLAEMAEDMAEAQGKDTCPVCHGTGQALFYCEDGSGRPRDGLCPVPCAYCGEAGQVDKPAHVTQWHRVKDLADFLGYEVNGTPDDDWLVTQAHTDDRGVRCADLDAVFKLLSEVKLPWE